MKSLESFLHDLKMHMLDKVIYAKEEKDFVVHSEELPPVIAPILRGPVVYNTEHLLKKTSSLRVHTFTV